MQTRNPLLDDLAKVLGGAMGTMGGMRESVEGRIKDRLAQLLAGMDLPGREEFEAIKEMAAKARAGEEALAARVAQLEARVAVLEAAKAAVPPAPATAPDQPESAENQAPEAGV